jgi:hypothetical protein
MESLLKDIVQVGRQLVEDIPDPEAATMVDHVELNRVAASRASLAGR